MSDARPFDQLMTDLGRGDPDAAHEVFDRYARRLVGLAAARLPGVTRSKVDPEDVVQSVFRTFFRRQSEGQFRPDHWDALWSLLAVLTVRKCGHQIEHLLAGKRDARRETVGAAHPDAAGSSVWQPADPTPSPEETTLFTETVERTLARLTERERPIVLLRLQGYGIEEIANQSRCSERTVHRILDGVRDRLQSLSAG